MVSWNAIKPTGIYYRPSSHPILLSTPLLSPVLSCPLVSSRVLSCPLVSSHLLSSGLRAASLKLALVACPRPAHCKWHPRVTAMVLQVGSKVIRTAISTDGLIPIPCLSSSWKHNLPIPDWALGLRSSVLGMSRRVRCNASARQDRC
jgi:hypothetical protein